MDKKLIYILVSCCIITAIVVVTWFVLIKHATLIRWFKSLLNIETYEDISECTLEQYFTKHDSPYSQDENTPEFWLKQESNIESDLYEKLQKDATDFRVNGAEDKAQLIEQKMKDLKVLRLSIRKKALAILEPTFKKGERKILGLVPVPNSSTVKSSKANYFNISDDTCSISTTIAEKTDVYTNSSILKPTHSTSQPQNIFTMDDQKSCYITIPQDADIDDALASVLDVLDAIGGKLDEPTLREIERINQEIFNLTNQREQLKSITIPTSQNEVQGSIDAYNQSVQNFNSMLWRKSNLESKSKKLQRQNASLQKKLDDSVMIFDGTGRKFKLSMGLTEFKGDKERFKNIQSIKFNENKGFSVIIYDNDSNPYPITKSTNIQNVKIGDTTISLQNNVSAIEVSKSVKYPTNSMITSLVNRKKVFDVSGGGYHDGAQVMAWGSPHGGNNQKWNYDPSSKNLQPLHSGKCLNAVEDGSLNQITCDWNNNNLKWDFTSSGQIKSVGSGKCIQAESSTITNNGGSSLFLQDCNDNIREQLWVVDNRQPEPPRQPTFSEPPAQQPTPVIQPIQPLPPPPPPTPPVQQQQQSVSKRRRRSIFGFYF